ncbi:Rrf2 family transcriptional regulator [Candidatus Peregrinibacteria bacterium]|jgi:Rrf2 family transcriptional regulator, cysteine metabolism repressor|nr:Rrf2 family transcriptional regulator [Candidatus Peregrinibacteria bacterium]MBT7702749.1 Rrf2 family transcriptional regulator [Candidatus Peregrinibacteria bacterium]
MLKVTRQADYGLLLVAALAFHYAEGEYVSLKHVAEKRKLPYRFLGKIVTPFKKVGIVESREGVTGGYRLARAPEKISIREVLEALGEPLSLVRCADSERACQSFCQCFSKRFWRDVQQKIDELLDNYTVADLIEEGSVPNVQFKI